MSPSARAPIARWAIALGVSCGGKSAYEGSAGTSGAGAPSVGGTSVGGAGVGGSSRATGGSSAAGGVGAGLMAGGTSGADEPAEAGAPGQCVSSGTLNPHQIPVQGTVRGPRVDAVLCDNGVGTIFLGAGAAAGSSYTQGLDTTTTESSEPLPDDFLFSMPSDVAFASLSGWVGATTAQIGAYSSGENCGWLALELSFQIPSGVVCPRFPEPCGPDCEGEGEAGVCRPAHPTWRYTASSGSQCGSFDDPRGQWQLTLTSVSPHVVPGTLINYSTHGRLTATLVNEREPSDTVVLDLEF
jgi:hypothetical protein